MALWSNRLSDSSIALFSLSLRNAVQACHRLQGLACPLLLVHYRPGLALELCLLLGEFLLGLALAPLLGECRPDLDQPALQPLEHP